MLNDLSPAQQEAYARASTSVVDLFSMELRHSTFPEPIRVISYDDGEIETLPVELEDYAPANPGEVVDFMCLAFKKPSDTIDTEPGNTFDVAVSGISNQVFPYLNVANETLEPIACTVRSVSLDTRDNTVVGVGSPSEMQVRNFRTGILNLQMTLGFTNLNTRTLDV